MENDNWENDNYLLLKGTNDAQMLLVKDYYKDKIGKIFYNPCNHKNNLYKPEFNKTKEKFIIDWIITYSARFRVIWETWERDLENIKKQLYH